MYTVVLVKKIVKITSLFVSSQNVCCGYSLEASQ